MKQTAVQLLRETIDSEMKLGTKMIINWDMYLEMEREQIIEATYTSIWTGEDYYNKTYKGSEL